MIELRKIGWSFGQPAISRPCFSSGSIVLFRIQEPLSYLASYTLEKNNFYTYYRLRHVGSLNIWDIYGLVDFFFFHSASEPEIEIFSMIANYYQ